MKYIKSYENWIHESKNINFKVGDYVYPRYSGNLDCNTKYKIIGITSSDGEQVNQTHDKKAHIQLENVDYDILAHVFLSEEEYNFNKTQNKFNL